MKTFLENLEMLSLAAGTSGDESAVRKLIYDEVIGYPDCTSKTDNAGNLIVSKKGKKAPKNRLMFSAHMDEVGFIITHIDENGFLKFSNVGGIDSRVIVGKRVRVGKNEIPFQVEAYGGSSTGTNADEIASAGAGVRTGLISIPQQYMHSVIEKVSVDDVKNVGRLLAAFVMEGGEN